MKRIDSASTQQRPAPKGRLGARELLLYVEDDDSNWQVAQLRLSQGYELVRAANAAEACRVLAARGRDLAAILMDIELRGSELNGVALTRLIRGKPLMKERPSYAEGLPSLMHTAIIFVTAHGAKYSEDQLLAAGGNKVIAKPVDFGALSLALTELHLMRAARRK
ncbi:MAG TPA: response regulator [Polyangiales bacterium]|nr:response regulator [Polyangiales bacterium]